MSFNRRGPGRRPDRPDRPPQRRGDWQPRDAGGGERPFTPRDRPGGERPFTPRDRPGGDRPYQPRGGDRPFTPRPRFDRPPDEGAMSIRLDPRRVSALKHLAGEAGVRPGDLVRQWVEERIDARHGGAEATAPPSGVMARLDELSARIAALEAASTSEPVTEAPTREADGETATASDETSPAPKPRGRPRKSASAAPAGPRVALHDEMIAVITERGPMPAGELAEAIAERGRYAPPRSGKPLDAAMISQRVSNPVYRSRFTRSDGRIGLAEES